MKIDITFKDATPEAIADWVAQNFKKVTTDYRLVPSNLDEIPLPSNSVTVANPEIGFGDYLNMKAIGTATEYAAQGFSQPAEAKVADEATPDYDAHGLPWDARIHSSSKKLTAKGVWARRKGVDEQEFVNISNELRGATSNTPVATAAQLFPQPAAPIEQPQIPAWLQDSIAQNNQQAANSQLSPAGFPPFNVAPTPQPTIVPQPSTVNYTFANLMQTISSLMAQGQIDANYIQTLSLKVGKLNNKTVHAIVDIGGDPAMIEQAFGILRTDGKVQ